MSQWTEWQLQKFQVLFEKYAKKKKDRFNNEYKHYIREKSLMDITVNIPIFIFKTIIKIIFKIY